MLHISRARSAHCTSFRVPAARNRCSDLKENSSSVPPVGNQRSYSTAVACGNGLDSVLQMPGTGNHAILHDNHLSKEEEASQIPLSGIRKSETENTVDLRPDFAARSSSLSLVAAFKSCANFASNEQGTDIGAAAFVKLKALDRTMAAHSDALNVSSLDKFAASTLIDAYSKCGSMIDARLVFDKLDHHDVVSWTTLIQGHADNGDEDLALELFHLMQTAANARTFVAASTACARLARKEETRQVDGLVSVKLGALERGLDVHSRATKAGFESNVFFASSLVNLYSKCGSLLDARIVFDRMQYHDAFSCTALMLGYADAGEVDLALELCSRFRFRNSIASGIFVAALSSFTALAAREEFQQLDGRAVKLAALERGRDIHRRASESGHSSDSHVACSLLDMYAKCGSLVEAFRVFDSTDHLRDVVLWNAMVSGCVDNGEEELALEVFSRMERPNLRSFSTAVKACSRLAQKEESVLVDGKMVKPKALEIGSRIHSWAVEHGCEPDLFLASALVDMYAKCGSLEQAYKVFHSMPRRCVVSCNALIHGYAESGEEKLALELFDAMEELPGCIPNSRTYVAALNACIGLAAKEEARGESDQSPVKVEALDRGMKIHLRATESGFEIDKFVACSLVNMYAKCGSLDDAWRVFHGMPRRDIVSWNVLVLGYAESKQPEVALRLFPQLRDEVEADSGTFTALLKACGSLAALEAGRALHSEIYRRGLEGDGVLATSALDFYSRCGSVIDAQLVFDSIAMRNVVGWSALIAGYSHQGDVERVLEHFVGMKNEGLIPNAVTFASVLAACSHGGLVERAIEHFREMSYKYGVRPGIDHYHCLVDVLGRANRIEEAVEVIRTMPFEADALMWKTLLAACRKWKNVETGKMAFESLMKLDENDGVGFVLMANLYAGQDEQQNAEMNI